MKKKLLFLAYTLIISSIMVSSLIVGYSKNNPLLNFTENHATYISAVLPQGWGFFTKSPRESVYVIESGEGADEVLLPNMDYRNLFGIIRKGRAQGVESGRILNEVPEESWNNCEIVDCSSDSISNNNDVITIKNDTPRPLLNGEYIIYEKSVIPWNYSQYYEESYLIKNYVKVHIR